MHRGPVAVLIAATALLALRAQGQSAFEVASIKPSSADASGPPFELTPAGTLSMNTTVKFLVQMAYGRSRTTAWQVFPSGSTRSFTASSPNRPPVRSRLTLAKIARKPRSGYARYWRSASNSLPIMKPGSCRSTRW